MRTLEPPPPALPRPHVCSVALRFTHSAAALPVPPARVRRSSRVRDFTVRGRQSHPKRDGHSDYALGFGSSTAWQLVGNFTAANSKGTQVLIGAALNACNMAIASPTHAAAHTHLAIPV